MHYVEAGQGTPVILLHGFPETWYCWRHQIPVLADRYDVIAPDLRGYGQTEVARGHWFFIFNNVPDVPEALITGREEIWLRFIFSTWCYNPELFTPDELAIYVQAYSHPGHCEAHLATTEPDVRMSLRTKRTNRNLSIVQPWSCGARTSHSAEKCGFSGTLAQNGIMPSFSIYTGMWSPAP
jgi:hypothetical protein